MRNQAEIKKHLLKLRFTDGITLVQIAKDSGCQVAQVIAAMKLEASELIQRRLDAYLDAPKLHRVTKETRLLARIENFTRELGRWKLRTIPMRDVYLMSPDQQRRLHRAMQWRLKKHLREYVKAKKGFEPRFPDANSYWRCKAQVASKFGLVAPE